MSTSDRYTKLIAPPAPLPEPTPLEPLPIVAVIEQQPEQIEAPTVAVTLPRMWRVRTN